MSRLRAGDLSARGHIELHPPRLLADNQSFDDLTAEFWDGVRLYPEQNKAIRHADDYDPRRRGDDRFRWRIHDIWIWREAALSQFDFARSNPAVRSATSALVEKSFKDKGGRATKYDWAGAAAHFAVKYQWEGVVSQRDLKKALNDWFSQQQKDVPDSSEVGKFVKAALDAIASAND